MKQNSDLSILVLSSDTYQPILKAFDFYFKKHSFTCLKLKKLKNVNF